MSASRQWFRSNVHDTSSDKWVEPSVSVSTSTSRQEPMTWRLTRRQLRGTVDAGEVARFVSRVGGVHRSETRLSAPEAVRWLAGLPSLEHMLRRDDGHRNLRMPTVKVCSLNCFESDREPGVCCQIRLDRSESGASVSNRRQRGDFQMKQFDARAYSVADFLEWDGANLLDLSPKFQRRSVWTRAAKSFLIDTILRGKPMPKVLITQKPSRQAERPNRG